MSDLQFALGDVIVGLGPRNMEKVPVARLKANLAHYLGRVKAGQSLVVTDRGCPVAVVEPVAWSSDEDEATKCLVVAGQISPASAELGDDFFRGPNVQDPECRLRKFLDAERRAGR
jgi:prevent-host-death family protein